jgi:hypothetical protein
MNSLPLFRRQIARDVFENYLKLVREEVDKKANEYVLNVNKAEWLDHITDRFKQVPLTIYPEKITQSLAGKGKRTLSQFGREYEVETTKIALSIPYEGTTFLLELCPSSYTLNGCKADVSGYGAGDITRTIELTSQDEQLFNAEKRQFIDYLNSNVPSVNKEAEDFNRRIVYEFNTAYEARKQKALSENSFFEKLNISIDPDTQGNYKVPVFEKKRVPEPVLDSKAPRKYTQTPVLDDDLYTDIIGSINKALKSVEKKPSIYKAKDEEELRDYLLPILENRYENSTVTGETFNKGGKTDILVRYKDGTNLFVAECKYWKGESGFLETVNQLFDRYLTWRDSKTALIFFVTNKEFSKVLATIRDAVKKHPYFLRETGNHGESSFSYIFRFPTDEGKHVYTEVMAFHFPE